MNVEIVTEAPIFLFWEYLLPIFGIFSLQYTLPFKPFRFGFEFSEIFVFENRLPAITDTGSRRLSVLVISVYRKRGQYV